MKNSLIRTFYKTSKLLNVPQNELFNYKLHTEKPEFPSSTVKPKTLTTLQDDQVLKLNEIIPSDRFGLSHNYISIMDYFYGNLHHSHHVFYSSLINERMKRAFKVEKKKFIDLKIIKCTTGNGGNGSISFFTDTFKSFGPPDGGDGGNGGDIYINVLDKNKNLNSLHYLKRSYVAGNGESGKSGQLDGKNGQDLIIDVPLGTIIRWIPEPTKIKPILSAREGDSLDDLYLEFYMDNESNIQLKRDGGYEPGEGWIFKQNPKEYYLERDFFNDLNKKITEYDLDLQSEEEFNDRLPIAGLDCNQTTEKPILLLKGGKGGLGNMHFLTPDVKNPRFCKIGRKGITVNFLLELKLIANLGLVGLPNAGKSSLLKSISRANPRVGHWEFTTLQPTIGTIQPNSLRDDSFTVADIPGIIKGASENKGMGLDFLRHIERSGGLVFVISLENKDPSKDLKILIDEVGEKRMNGKKVLVVATKADLSEHGDNYKVLKKYVEDNFNDWKIVPVCAANGENIDKCIKLMSEIAKMEDKSMNT
ncbi:unnamed protein product [Candida verbasci]|uniref:GTPase MTG2, mitochondrial n=1 Tax=Candida verbasci TaxID=1227364 RepID=A0A9W4X8A8_9ASCO|nr:unnamed protein product [Candida verbasci]